MPVIDVDSHFEPTAFEPGEHPLWELRDQLPSRADVMIANIAGDLYDAMPPDQRPDAGLPCCRASGRRWACRRNRSTTSPLPRFLRNPARPTPQDASRGWIASASTTRS